MRNFKFTVQINGFPSTMGFSKVSGLSSEVEVIEYREGGNSITARKFPGQMSFGNVTLERGLTTDSDLVQWMNSVFDPSANADQAGDNFRTDVTIQVKSKSGQPEREFKLKNAFATSREISDLDGSGNEIIIETLELAHEGLVETLYNSQGSPRTPATLSSGSTILV